MGGNTGGALSGKESVATAIIRLDLPVPRSPITTTWQRTPRGTTSSLAMASCFFPLPPPPPPPPILPTPLHQFCRFLFQILNQNLQHLHNLSLEQLLTNSVSHTAPKTPNKLLTNTYHKNNLFLSPPPRLSLSLSLFSAPCLLVAHTLLQTLICLRVDLAPEQRSSGSDCPRSRSAEIWNVGGMVQSKRTRWLVGSRGCKARS